MRMRLWLLCIGVFAYLVPVAGYCQTTAKGNGVDRDLLTEAELSNYRSTARSETVVKFIDRVDQRADHISRFDFGKTFEGRPMVGAIVANPHVTSPEQLRNDKRLVVLIIGNIHSGECCGQEAMMKMLRELCLNPNHPWLKELVLLVVPNYNSDGNERRAKNNRPGQVGPVEGMGTRANAQGFDLNRDYIKLEAPESRALVALMTRWNPHCFIDLHTTNGSWHRYQLTYDVHHNPGADSALEDLLRKKLIPTVTKNLFDKGVDTIYYGNFGAKNTVWATYDHRPRYGLDYVALRNRLGILSEAYSYITFKERIEATHAFVGECLNYLAANAQLINDELKRAEGRVVDAGKSPKAGDMVAIAAKMVKYPEKITVKGYDPPSRPRIRQDAVPGVAPDPPGKPKDYLVDFLADFEPTKTVQRPFAYVIPESQKTIIEKLKQHGIKVDQLAKAAKLPVEVYTWKELKKSARPFQNHNEARAIVSSSKEERTIPANSFVVRTGQPLGNLAIYLLEPESDDGLVTWNYFDDTFRPGAEFPVLRLLEPAELTTR